MIKLKVDWLFVVSYNVLSDALIVTPRQLLDRRDPGYQVTDFAISQGLGSLLVNAVKAFTAPTNKLINIT